MTRIVVIGSLNMDLVFRVARAPQAGETLTGLGFAAAGGGKGANQALACARMIAPTQDVTTAMIGCIGADGFGETLVTGLAADGVDVAGVLRDPAAPTGVAMVMVEESGQNRIVVAPGANALLTPARIEAAAATIRGASLVAMQLETPIESVLRAAQIARDAGALTVLNPAPARPPPDALWPLVDTLIPNESEASALSGVAVVDVASASRAARALLARGCGRVLITLGAQGVLIADAQGERHLPAKPVAALDTTAAGDTFIGGYLAALAEGADIEAAAELGQRAAALCVTRAGAQPSIPWRREL